MALRQWLVACSGPAANRIEGLCGRLRDTLQSSDEDCGNRNDDDDDDAMMSMGHKSALWKDLTCSVLEPSVPKEISVTLPDDTAIWSSSYWDGLEDDTESLVGLEILADDRDESHPSSVAMCLQGTPSPPWSPTECSWTYSTTSSHGKDAADLKFDDGSSYSSSGKPPRPTLPPPHPSSSSVRVKSHKKTISNGTAITASTASRSRSSTWGSM